MPEKLVVCKTCGAKVKNLGRHVAKAHQKSPSPVQSTVPRAPKGKKEQAGGYDPYMSGTTNLLRPVVDRHLGTSAEGRRYALRHLHPCDETLAGGERIPDEWAGSSAALELRARGRVAAPGQGSWDCALLCFPSPDCPVVIVTRSSGAEWPTAPGTRTPIQFPILPLQHGSGVPGRLAHMASSYRGVYKGVTVHHVKSSLNNQGMVYAGQWSQIPDVELDTSTNPAQPVNLYNSLPLEIDDLYGKDASMTAREAKEGVYMPFRFSQPTYTYQAGTATTGKATSVQYTYFKTDGSEQLSTVDNTNGSWCNTSPHIGLNMGVILFTGLDVTASLDVKVRQGLEVITEARSPWSGFLETGPPLDRMALDRVRYVSSQLAGSYPSAYNDFGLLSGPIAALAAKAVLGGALGWGTSKVLDSIKGRGNQA